MGAGEGEGGQERGGDGGGWGGPRVPGRLGRMSFRPCQPPLPPVPPQANATNVAVMRTASPRARTIWFPLVFIGRPETSGPTASPHSPPSSQLKKWSGRECAGDECGHMGWPNHYSGQNFGLDRACKSSVSLPNSTECLRT